MTHNYIHLGSISYSLLIIHTSSTFMAVCVRVCVVCVCTCVCCMCVYVCVLYMCVRVCGGGCMCVYVCGCIGWNYLITFISYLTFRVHVRSLYYYLLTILKHPLQDCKKIARDCLLIILEGVLPYTKSYKRRTHHKAFIKHFTLF